MRRFACGTLALVLPICAASGAVAETPRTVLMPGGADEGVGIVIPEGWTLAWREEQAQTAVLEFLPTGETRADWTGMITVHRFSGLAAADPEQFLRRVEVAFDSACEAVLAGTLQVDRLEDLPVGLHSVACTADLESGMGEIALFTAIAGRRALYVFQRSWRVAAFAPDALPLAPETMAAGSADIAEIFVCSGSEGGARCPEALHEAVAQAASSLSPSIR